MPMPADYAPAKRQDLGPKKLYDAMPTDGYVAELLDCSPEEDEYEGEKQQVLRWKAVLLDGEEFIGRHNGLQKPRGRLVWFNTSEYIRAPVDGRPDVKLYKFATAALRRPMSPAECKAFRPEQLYGKQLKLNLEFRTSAAGNDWNKFLGAMPTRKDLPPYDHAKEGVQTPRPGAQAQPSEGYEYTPAIPSGPPELDDVPF